MNTLVKIDVPRPSSVSFATLQKKAEGPVPTTNGFPAATQQKIPDESLKSPSKGFQAATMQKKEEPTPKKEEPTPKKEAPTPKKEAPAPKTEESTPMKADRTKSDVTSPEVRFFLKSYFFYRLLTRLFVIFLLLLLLW